MKLAKNLNPKQIWKNARSRSRSRSSSSSHSCSRDISSSDLSSGSLSSSSDGTSSSSSSAIPHQGSTTPVSVLPVSSSTNEILPAEWTDELVQAFNIIDKDGDGKITRSELEALLSRIGADPLSEEEMTMMMTDVDRDGDGCISLEKFGAISSALGPACGSELRDAFDIFDADRDGKISAEELLEIFAAIGDDRCTLEDCRRMIDGVDSDGDGFVCFEDFSKMMEQQQQLQRC